MNTKTEIKLSNGKIEVTTKREHELSKLEKEILKSLAINGYYEMQKVDFDSQLKEQNAMNTLIHLGLANEDMDAWHFTINAVESNEVNSFFTQINKYM